MILIRECVCWCFFLFGWIAKVARVHEPNGQNRADTSLFDDSNVAVKLKAVKIHTRLFTMAIGIYLILCSATLVNTHTHTHTRRVCIHCCTVCTYVNAKKNRMRANMNENFALYIDVFWYTFTHSLAHTVHTFRIGTRGSMVQSARS